MDKKIKALEAKITAQDAHIARMIKHNPVQESIKAAKRILFVQRAELEYLMLNGTTDGFDLFAAAAAARAKVR